MKQRVLIIFGLCFALINANAQKIGVKAGLNLSDAKYEIFGTGISTSSLVGFHAGLICETALSESVYLNAAALYSMKGATISLLGAEADFPISYVEIPVNIAYKYDLGGAKLFAQVGPYAGIGISAKVKGAGGEETIDFGSAIDELKRFDFGANFGAGVEIMKVQLGVSYGLGLVNISNDPDESIKNGGLSFSVVLYFNE